ncbi:hypothetical protein ACH427_18280 [Streptomyces sp. NPDC020379]|uniref:sulfotransferase-like domain-containing protein n=1 Tax=Streptomyces sp. NPDC020379 TaxID=3365071 RepID=UPI0037B27EF0
MMSERGDFRPLHDPFSYLMEFGSVDAAGRRISDETGLLARARELSADRPLFFKDTTDERCPGLLGDALYAFIIRHPRETIASYRAINPGVRQHQIGFEAQYERFERVQELTGTVPAVVDAADLVEAPERTVKAYCDAAGSRTFPRPSSGAAAAARSGRRARSGTGTRARAAASRRRSARTGSTWTPTLSSRGTWRTIYRSTRSCAHTGWVSDVGVRAAAAQPPVDAVRSGGTGR